LYKKKGQREKRKNDKNGKKGQKGKEPTGGNKRETENRKMATHEKRWQRAKYGRARKKIKHEKKIDKKNSAKKPKPKPKPNNISLLTSRSHYMSHYMYSR
jgi:hypothetical protein